MWHFISEHISEVTGTLFICQHHTEVKGGDTHNNYVIRDDVKRYFVKTSPNSGRAVLQSEADGLAAIKRTETLLTPNVICCGTAKCKGQDTDYLVLQHLRLVDGNKNDWRKLGHSIASLHKSTHESQYGWQCDNFIGSTPQCNAWNANWALFFAEQRIGFLTEKLAQQGYIFAPTEQLVEVIAKLLHNHQPYKSTLHGDLWSGNIGFAKQQPTIFDPAVYIGDRETDIAMSELFGGFPNDFYLGYNEHWPLPDGYALRKKIYQLYHILNHALLFHAHYISMAKSAVKEIQSH